MKSFVRDNHDAILFGFVGAGVLALAIGNHLFGEVVFLPLIVAYSVQLAWEFRRWLKNRAKERSGGARSTGSH
jgi:hypothetical protein